MKRTTKGGEGEYLVVNELQLLLDNMTPLVRVIYLLYSKIDG